MDRILAKTGVGTWFAEIPLMKESYVEYFDRIWYVKSTDEQRIARVVKRDNMSVAAAMRIMRAQTEYSGIEEYATDIIINDGSVSGLRQSVKDLCRGLDEK
jgi:dephospho-CoA kinase